MDQNWPDRLWLVRHGESAGNVLRDAAEAGGSTHIAIAERDVDVPLSPRGHEQARSLGRWLAAQSKQARPSVILSSPYLRALETTEEIVEALGGEQRSVLRMVDERLREKEFGALNRLTKAGIAALYPREAELRAHVGKFYYRPPSGESWCDVLLRLRSVLDHIQLQYRGERVLVVAHQVVVLCFRYLLDRLTEKDILAIDAQGDVANCSLTTYEFQRDAQGRGGMVLRAYNAIEPLRSTGAPVTAEKDTPVAPR